MSTAITNSTPQGVDPNPKHSEDGPQSVLATSSSTKGKFTSSTRRNPTTSSGELQPAGTQLGDAQTKGGKERRETSDQLTRVESEASRTRPPNEDVEKGEKGDRKRAFFNRVTGKGRITPTWMESLKDIAMSSWLNALLVFVPLSWTSHFLHWSPDITFAFSIVAIIPLERIFDYLGEELALYCGRSLGDLIIITLNNAVEATLAIILLNKCELRLVQSTIVGVILLHLLLVPGCAFLTGGAKVWQQHLHEHPVQLNHVLLTFGVLTLLVPTAFFAALEDGFKSASSPLHARATTFKTGSVIDLSEYNAVSDESRGVFLKVSRGIACVMMVIYIASRIYLHNPPGDDNALKPPPGADAEEQQEELETEVEQPKVNPWVCMIVIVVTVGLMACTAEWLVYSLEYLVSEKRRVTREWLGLILLPLVSFSGDGLVAIWYFIQTLIGLSPPPPRELAKGRAIDLSIQFSLFWMPLFVLISWWIHKPLSLLFDVFEVAIVIAACFLVNYVTQDAKTNWVEGLTMVSFYVTIALAAWFYPGQLSHGNMLACLKSVAETVASGGIGDH